jgi:polyhydroxybutyrate depolymerase
MFGSMTPSAPSHWLFVVMSLTAICCGGPARAETIDVNGAARSFIAQFPDRKPAPLVIVLHGNSQTGADMMTRTAWPEVARREHFAVVFPDGLNRAWADLRPNARRALRAPPEGTDDVTFIAKLVDRFVIEGRADPKHVYITGVSNGGAMTMTLLCARAELFAAAATVIFNLTDDMAKACQPRRPVPILLMNGTADPLIPYQGGRGTSFFAKSGFWSTEQTVRFWRQVNGCEAADGDSRDLTDRDPADQSTVTRISSRCPPGQDVALYRVNGGGHRMPGRFADARFMRAVNFMLGPQNRDIDGAETIWTFFSQVR